MSNLDKPAMPDPSRAQSVKQLAVLTDTGLTIRQHAAIELRVPMSGDPELDAMIREARRLDMQAGLISAITCEQSSGTTLTNREIVEWANKLIAASEPKKAEPETIRALRSRLSQKMDDCTAGVKRIDALTAALKKAREHCLNSEWNPAVQEAIAVIEEALFASVKGGAA